MKVHPKSRNDLPRVGVFATRTQYRPNPIGLTLVELLGRRENVLRVRGLDALSGTPVLDLKPISPAKEFPKRTRVPGWYGRLWTREAEEKRGSFETFESSRKSSSRASEARPGIQDFQSILDSGFCRNDEKEGRQTFYETLKCYPFCISLNF